MDPDFQRLHDVWYRRWRLCEMHWSEGSTRLHGCFVAAAPNGGPIATVRDARVFQPSRGTTTSDLQIFTAGGIFIGGCPWTYDQLVTMQWTPDETLLCVFQNGVIRIFSVFSEVLYCFHMDPRIRKENGIISAIIAPEGVIVVLTGSLRLFANLAFNKPQCIKLADCPITSPPNCIKTIPTSTSSIYSSNPRPTISGSLSSCFAVLVAAEQGSLYLVDQVRSLQLPVTDGPFSIICPSPSGRAVACISQGGTLQVFSTSSDFSRPLDKASLRSSGRPRQVCWVGEDCLAYHVGVPTPDGPLEHFVFVGGPNNEWLPYQFGGDAVHLVSEIDGLRVIGGSSSYFIHRVAKSTYDIFSVGSCRPAAMLVYASTQYSAGNALVNEAMKTVLSDLPQAISLCIDAAEREIDPGRISMLLKSAAFGRLFLRDYVTNNYSKKASALSSASKMPEESSAIAPCNDSSDSREQLHKLQEDVSRQYLKAIRDLRLVMALHNLPTEMLLTVAQFRWIGPGLLMRILSQRRMHLMALRIGEWLGLGEPKRILKIHSVIQEDCSEELRDVCSYFWQSSNIQNVTDVGGIAQPLDFTRPPGVALALSPSSRMGIDGKGIRRGGPATAYGVRNETDDRGQRSPMCFVLEHWTKEKISTSVEKTDQELLTLIRGILDQFPNIRPEVTQVALWAAQFSRPNLATLLLQFEPRSRVQVRMLLRLAEINLAVKQAVTAGDPDLIVECLQSIVGEAEEEGAIQKLVEILERFPLLWDFYAAVCDRSGTLERIQRLHERAENFSRAGYDCILRSIRESDVEKKKAFVAHASGFFGSSRDLGQKGLRVTQQLSLEYVELMNLQKQLEQKAITKNWPKQPCALVNKTLAETVKELYLRGQTQEVANLQKLFEFSPKRLLKIQIEALLENKLPDEVVALGQSRSNQVAVGGVELFIKALHRSGNSEAAAKLLPSISSNSNLERFWFSRLFPSQSSSSDSTSTSTAQGRIATTAGSLMESLFSR